MKVIVGKGKNEKSFFVHQGLICGRSKFFNNAINGSWSESEDRVVRLPDDTPKVFELCLELLYSRSLPIRDDSDGGKKSTELSSLSKLYVLAKKLMDVESKNATIMGMLARG